MKADKKVSPHRPRTRGLFAARGLRSAVSQSEIKKQKMKNA